MPPKHKAGQDGGEASPNKQSKPDPNSTLPDTDDSINEQSMHDAPESPDAHYQATGGRQDSRSQATPQTSTPGTTPGTAGTPQYTVDPGQSTSAGSGPSAGQVLDLTKVCEAVQNSGGAPTQKPPDLDNLTPRIGQDLKVVNSTLNYEEEDFTVPARPDEASLRRITHAELLPPPSSRPVPLDLEFDPDAPEFVSQQRIEFLILMKTESDSTIPWGFPDKDTLQKLLAHVRDECDHDQIMEVALWSWVDASNIASMMLSTVNLPLMAQVSHLICIYSGHVGYKFESYAKSSFVKKYGITMYIPANQSGFKDTQLLRTLAYKYPALRCKMCIIHKSTFLSDPPNHPPGKRSRIGDSILLLDRVELNERLANFSEDFKFFLNDGFSVTLKGGIRREDTGVHLSSQFRQSVIIGAAAEATNLASGSCP